MPLFAKTTPKSPKTTPFLSQSILPARPYPPCARASPPLLLHETPDKNKIMRLNPFFQLLRPFPLSPAPCLQELFLVEFN
jgi:hypothetical protein